MKTGRKRTGRIYWTASGWHARITIDIDGVAVRKSFDLGTKDRTVARIKLKYLLAQQGEGITPEEAVRVETFEEAALRIVDESTIRTKGARLNRLKFHVFPVLGAKPVSEIVAGDVHGVLQAMATNGVGKQQCSHVRNDISSVLGDLWRSDMVPENVTRKVKIPRNAKVDNRERAVLSDAELMAYLAWQHPSEKRRIEVVERKTMACLSRMFGGLRWGDIKALRWEYFDNAEGKFSQGWATRKKTARAQALEVPEVLRPILRDWWEGQKKPSEGLIFPTRNGQSAGAERKNSSIAKALRRDLRRAFGIDEPTLKVITRKNGRKDTRIEWREARTMTERERELLVATQFTRPVDFHSFRRQFKQGLADAGVDVQRSMALSGATDMAAHQRYLTNTGKMLRIPASALPAIKITGVSKKGTGHAFLPEAGHTTEHDLLCRRADLNCRPGAYETPALTN